VTAPGKPRVRQFKLSTDPQFVAKLRDIVGLYVDPPAHAIVLSVDEKSQIQALDRTQPGLPLKPIQFAPRKWEKVRRFAQLGNTDTNPPRKKYGGGPCKAPFLLKRRPSSPGNERNF
jgi:hypothetical protein